MPKEANEAGLIQPRELRFKPLPCCTSLFLLRGRSSAVDHPAKEAGPLNISKLSFWPIQLSNLSGTMP